MSYKPFASTGHGRICLLQQKNMSLYFHTKTLCMVFTLTNQKVIYFPGLDNLGHALANADTQKNGYGIFMNISASHYYYFLFL